MKNYIEFLRNLFLLIVLAPLLKDEMQNVNVYLQILYGITIAMLLLPTIKNVISLFVKKDK